MCFVFTLVIVAAVAAGQVARHQAAAAAPLETVAAAAAVPPIQAPPTEMGTPGTLHQVHHQVHPLVTKIHGQVHHQIQVPGEVPAVVHTQVQGQEEHPIGCHSICRNQMLIRALTGQTEASESWHLLQHDFCCYHSAVQLIFLLCVLGLTLLCGC